MELQQEKNQNEERITSRIFLEIFKLRGVNFHYPMQRECLFDINLDIEQGEKIAIVGRSGSGKSTLAKLLVGYYYKPAHLFDAYPTTQRGFRKLLGLQPQVLFIYVGYMKI